ncbi:MAG: FHA domain-containing protein [Verrucomicrobiae bacterium]|nr:FHA domain-containing protein [Verrucomicrobiae bacterium]
MPRLTVNPDTASAWVIELQPGVNSLGRGEGNDVPIEHASVSSAHCQISVTEAGVMLKDLGSVNGTYLGEALVEEATLLPGQLIRLGDVVMRFEGDASPAGERATPATVTNQPSISAFCKSHPKAVARYRCTTCGGGLCELCVNTRMSAGRPTKFCRACGSECAPLFDEVEPETPRFAPVIGGAFSYPFKHDGLILLLAGTVFYTLIDLMSRVVPLIGLILMLFGTGYLVCYMQRILVASAMGEKRMPDWPDLSNWSEVFPPFFQFLGTIVFSFAPAILVRVFAPRDAAWADWAYVGGVIWGCFYFPMAFTAVAMFDTLGALNPWLILKSILRIPGAYLLAVGLLLAAYGAGLMGDHFLGQLLPIPILPVVISQFLGLYLITVEMHILGLLYWTKKAELGWFRG